MTRAAVHAAAGKGKIVSPPADEEDDGEDGVAGTYPFGPFKVAVKLEFDLDHKSQLSQVQIFPLLADPNSCPQVGAWLTATYGPMKHDNGAGQGYRTRTWIDAANHNEVDWVTEGPGYLTCEIDLYPVK